MPKKKKKTKDTFSPGGKIFKMFGTSKLDNAMDKRHEESTKLRNSTQKHFDRVQKTFIDADVKDSKKVVVARKKNSKTLRARRKGPNLGGA